MNESDSIYCELVIHKTPESPPLFNSGFFFQEFLKESCGIYATIKYDLIEPTCNIFEFSISSKLSSVDFTNEFAIKSYVLKLIEMGFDVEYFYRNEENHTRGMLHYRGEKGIVRDVLVETTSESSDEQVLDSFQS